MSIGDIVEYLPARHESVPVLGVIVGMHDTRNQYGWLMTVYHVEWFNDGTEGWVPANALTHETAEYIAVYDASG